MFAVLAGVGLAVDSPFATTVVVVKEYLPNRPALSSGITYGLAIGLGGLGATGLGALADATSITTVFTILPPSSRSSRWCSRRPCRGPPRALPEDRGALGLLRWAPRTRPLRPHDGVRRPGGPRRLQTRRPRAATAPPPVARAASVAACRT